MKPLFSILLCLFMFSSLFAQERALEDIKKDIKEYIVAYDKLSPWSYQMHAYDDIKTKKWDLIDLGVLNENRELISDSIEEVELIEYYRESISDLIAEELLIHKDFSIDSISEKDFSNSISIVKSPDNKIVNFSFFIKTGGTMQEFESIIYYYSDSTTKIYREDRLEGSRTVFNTNGYSKIDTIKTEEGVKYLFEGTDKVCSVCYYSHIALMSVKEGEFIVDFRHDLETKYYYNTDIFYDKSKREIRTSYLTDDMAERCECNEIFMDIIEEESLKKTCKCLFKFNGKTFVENYE